jgi:branched-chain amino acid transport system ATP-binding protein
MSVLLEIDGLVKRFGGLEAVSEFGMGVAESEIVGLIGPNGAGKSTIFNMITGVYFCDKGTVIFDGLDITRKRPHEVAALGIGRTFQLNPLFSDFTVLENVIASTFLHPRSSWGATFFNTGTYRRNERVIRERAVEILEVVGLLHMKDEMAKNLPHGYQKMLGVARALATRPRMMLLDEPLQGMNPSEIEHSLRAFENARQQGMTFLIVEHNMRILESCDRVVVISFGQKICEGTPQQIRENSEVVGAYLGGSHVA